MTAATSTRGCTSTPSCEGVTETLPSSDTASFAFLAFCSRRRTPGVSRGSSGGTSTIGTSVPPPTMGSARDVQRSADIALSTMRSRSSPMPSAVGVTATCWSPIVTCTGAARRDASSRATFSWAAPRSSPPTSTPATVTFGAASPRMANA